MRGPWHAVHADAVPVLAGRPAGGTDDRRQRPAMADHARPDGRRAEELMTDAEFELVRFIALSLQELLERDGTYQHAAERLKNLLLAAESSRQRN
jgi:hypothetical protein